MDDNMLTMRIDESYYILVHNYMIGSTLMCTKLFPDGVRCTDVRATRSMHGTVFTVLNHEAC